MPSKLPKLPNTVRGKDYIETKDWSVKEIDLALKTAGDLKKLFRSGKASSVSPRQVHFSVFLRQVDPNEELV